MKAFFYFAADCNSIISFHFFGGGRGVLGRGGLDEKGSLSGQALHVFLSANIV